MKESSGGEGSPKQRICTSLVVSSSSRGPTLFVFCRDPDCRRRILKAGTMTVSGTSLPKGLLQAKDGCDHPSVILKRAPHLEVSVTCEGCHQSSTAKAIYVESVDVILPKVNWSKKGTPGDSFLPKGDSRLIRKTP